jgi:ABC-type nitrate/sulfonate/bicarbonate transport system substrate-binding protein
VYAALLKSFNEVTDFINAHKEQAVKFYLETFKDKSATKVAASQGSSRQSGYPLHDGTTTQDGTAKLMYKTGHIKIMLEVQTDTFLPGLHNLPIS